MSGAIDWETVCELAEAADWECAFGESKWTTTHCHRGPLCRADVAEVIAAFAHNGEGPRAGDPLTRANASIEPYYGQIEMHAVVRLNDGRFGYVYAGADTIGWGCQDSNQFEVAATLAELIPLIGDEGRAMLGLAEGVGSSLPEVPK